VASGTLTLNTPSITREWPQQTVAINKEDAAVLGITTGTPVKVSGKNGSVTLPADVTADVKKGVVSLPMVFAAAAVKIEIMKEA